jgi:hypothetical protein
MDIVDSILVLLSLAIEWAKAEPNRNLLGTAAAIIAIIGGVWAAVRWVRGRDYDTRFDNLEEQTNGIRQSVQSISESRSSSDERRAPIHTHRQVYVEELVKLGINLTLHTLVCSSTFKRKAHPFTSYR